jgi:S-adenosylmethionine/arginine decarboxylase-like enzyme
MPWGQHLLLDCTSGRKDLITSRENIQEFVNTLIPAIGMKAYGPTYIEHFATHDIGKAGFSMFQMIETSNISAHFVDSSGDFYLDVFSCKSFDIDLVLALARVFFKPETVTHHLISRG